MIVFLDFDGVTHPVASKQQDYFSAHCMQALKQAFSGLDIKIVVSSTWREAYSLATLKKWLAPLQQPIIGVTPVINEPYLESARRKEIELFLNTICTNEAWVAIDDNEEYFNKNDEHLYRTNPKIGFCESDVSRLRAKIKVDTLSFI